MHKYTSIYVPLDNSDHSNVAADLAVSLGKALGAKLIGGHAYAAKLHDVRFKQMEFTLPDEYKEENELEKQRQIHDALITRGLQLISDSYLDQLELRAKEAGVEFEPRHYDGKNFEVIVQDVEACNPDLVILGALGQGAVRDSTVGSVCERVLRRSAIDTLVIRDLENRDTKGPGAIAVCIDGSARSYGALRSAVSLAEATDKAIELVVVLADDPEEAALQRAHLRVARDIVDAASRPSTTKILQGSVVPALVEYANEAKPFVLVVGRAGIDESQDLGATAERVVRHVSCNILVGADVMRPADIAAVAE